MHAAAVRDGRSSEVTPPWLGMGLGLGLALGFGARARARAGLGLGLGLGVPLALLEGEPFWSGFSPMPRSMEVEAGHARGDVRH